MSANTDYPAFSDAAHFLSRCPQDFCQRALVSPRYNKQPHMEKKAAWRQLLNEGGGEEMQPVCCHTGGDEANRKLSATSQLRQMCARKTLQPWGGDASHFSTRGLKPRSSQAPVTSTISTVSTSRHQRRLQLLLFSSKRQSS